MELSLSACTSLLCKNPTLCLRAPPLCPQISPMLVFCTLKAKRLNLQGNRLRHGRYSKQITFRLKVLVGAAMAHPKGLGQMAFLPECFPLDCALYCAGHALNLLSAQPSQNQAKRTVAVCVLVRESGSLCGLVGEAKPSRRWELQIMLQGLGSGPESSSSEFRICGLGRFRLSTVAVACTQAPEPYPARSSQLPVNVYDGN